MYAFVKEEVKMMVRGWYGGWLEGLAPLKAMKIIYKFFFSWHINRNFFMPFLPFVKFSCREINVYYEQCKREGCDAMT